MLNSTHVGMPVYGNTMMRNRFTIRELVRLWAQLKWNGTRQHAIYSQDKSITRQVHDQPAWKHTSWEVESVLATNSMVSVKHIKTYIKTTESEQILQLKAVAPWSSRNSPQVRRIYLLCQTALYRWALQNLLSEDGRVMADSVLPVWIGALSVLHGALNGKYFACRLLAAVTFFQGVSLRNTLQYWLMY